MANKGLLYLVILLGATLALLVSGCNESTTEPGNFTVSINMAVPTDNTEEDLNGSNATAYMFENSIDETPLYTSTAQVANDNLAFTIDEVSEGEYVVFVVLDITEDVSSGDIPIAKGDAFWGALDVEVANDLTINLTEDYWQRYHSIIVTLTGIPSGHSGQVLGCALAEDGHEIWEIVNNMLMGSLTLLYNNTAILGLDPSDTESDTEWDNYQLETGEYDLHFLIDHDGNIEDYDSETDVDPFTDGDLVYTYDYSYSASSPADQFPLVTATFEPIEFTDITLTINYTLPEDAYEYLLGDTLRAGLWTSTVEDDPLFESSQVISSMTGTITVDVDLSGTYLVAVTIGDDEGIEEDDFVAWAGLDVELAADMSITIAETWWQWIEDITIGVTDIPSGHDGELALFALWANNGDYTDFHDMENFIMGGIGFVYNNAAFATMHSPQDDSGYWELPTGTYDLGVFIDPDGDYEYYYHMDLDTMGMFMPYDVDDPYWIGNYEYDALTDYEEFRILEGSFTPMLGISGMVTCPEWTSGGGDIYVLTFNLPPFDTSATDNDPFTWDVISQPGAYAIPIFPEFSGYIVGVWDANGNGLEGEVEGEGGPDLGDFIGGYGSALDSLYLIEILSTDVNDIDFTIDIPWDDSLDN